MAKKLKLAHPGKILREEFMEPVGLSAYALAKSIRVPLPRVNDIVRERRAVSAHALCQDAAASPGGRDRSRFLHRLQDGFHEQRFPRSVESHRKRQGRLVPGVTFSGAGFSRAAPGRIPGQSRRL